MIILYSVILVIIVVIWIWSQLRKPVLPTTEQGYSKPFLASAVMLYRWAGCIRNLMPRGGDGGNRVQKNRKLAANLQTLYPGESSDSQLYRFRVETISTIFLLAFLGSALGLLLAIVAIDQGVLEDGNVIYRSEYAGANVNVNLTAGINVNEEIKEEFAFPVSVSARIYSETEANELFEKMSLEIDELILAENDKPEHILKPISFMKNVPGYPFSISWECSNYELLDSDGIVHNRDLDAPELITITADCSYEHNHWYLVRTLQICPEELSLQEKMLRELEDTFNDIDQSSASERYMTLPSSISYGDIDWKENISDDSGLAILITILISLLVPVFKESEITGSLKKRSKDLLIEYPSFVSKLTLYMGAGMSVRNCFLRMGRENAKKDKKKRTSLGNELMISAHELEMGIPELEVYEKFGKRCANREYMRFSALLTQNLRKGSTDLVSLLQKESDDAFVIRKNEARKLGEEASTKLLLPMVMMLAVVMVIIMVPAYMSFSS